MSSITPTRPKPALNPGFVLYDYQNDAIKWMHARERAHPFFNHGINGGLLCLQMGQGKTLTALEEALQAQSNNNEQFPTLIIASKTVMYEWKNNGIEKFYTNINTLYLHRDFIGDNIDTITGEEIVANNIVITTYDQCLSASRKHDAHKLVCEYGQEGIHKDKVIAIHNRKRPPYKPKQIGTSNIYQIPWARAICDESQRFANYKTYTFKAVMAIYADHKWCLTGTPIRNYDADIWSQLRFCGYDTISAARLWRRGYFKDQGLREYMFESNYVDANVEMTEKIEHTHLVEMDPDQEQTYKALLIQTQNMHEKMLMKFISYASVLAMLMRLRQVCIAPHLIVSRKTKKGDTVQQEIDQTVVKTNVDRWITDDYGSAGIDSPKVKKIVDIIENIPAGEKIILFSMFTTCLQIIEKAIQLDLPHKSYELLSGSNTGQERVDILTNFKQNPNVTILLVHYKVGGEGLNLTEANHVICIEPWWSPSVHNQGIARAWRRGQTKPVHVHWIITNKTIEIPILKMCENKDQLTNFYINDGKYDPQPTGLNKHEMQKLLGLAANM